MITMVGVIKLCFACLSNYHGLIDYPLLFTHKASSQMRKVWMKWSRMTSITVMIAVNAV